VRAVLLTLIVVIVLVLAGGAAFVYSGVYDVAAANPDNQLVARVIHLASDRSVAARLDSVTVPAAYDGPDKVLAGAKIYGQTCVVCHSGPGLKPTDIALGLNPMAPGLFRAGRKPDPKENYWFVSNGVKMTGMPAFSKSLSDDEIWSVVAFLNTAPGMAAANFTSKTGLTAPPTATPTSGAAADSAPN
jgi:mono/diheme cytochrome c family protein